MRTTLLLAVAIFIAGCASPPKTDPSKAELSCARECNAGLATCSSGFKLFPVIAQQQCNDNFDVCIKTCPERK